MAYRRSLTTSARLFTQQRFTPSISYVHHHEDRKRQHSDEKSHSFLQSRSYGVFCNSTNALRNCVGSRGLRYQDPRWSHFIGAPSAFLLARNMSTNIANDVVAQATPVISEVAAGYSCLPVVAAMQYFIEGIRNFTGLHWWATIVLTTVILRSLAFSTCKKLMKGIVPRDKSMKFEEWTDEFLSRYTLAMWMSCAFCSSHLFALADMVKYVPSFKTGGTSWFLDLTTTDSYFGLPCLVLLSFYGPTWYSKRSDPDIRLRIIVNVVISGVLAVPLTLYIPKALLISFITSNLLNAVHDHSMKKLLNHWRNNEIEERKIRPSSLLKATSEDQKSTNP